MVWRVPGALERQLGAILGHRPCFGRPWGRSWASLWRLWGPCWSHLGVMLWPCWLQKLPKGCPRASKIRLHDFSQEHLVYHIVFPLIFCNFYVIFQWISRVFFRMFLAETIYAKTLKNDTPPTKNHYFLKYQCIVFHFF